MDIKTNLTNQPDTIKAAAEKIRTVARKARHNGGLLRDEVYRVVSEVVADHNCDMSAQALVDQHLICGTGGSHIWVSRDDDEMERILIIT